MFLTIMIISNAVDKDRNISMHYSYTSKAIRYEQCLGANTALGLLFTSSLLVYTRKITIRVTSSISPPSL